MEREYGLTARQMSAWLAKGFDKHFNNFPSAACPVVRVQKGDYELVPMRWGLIPRGKTRPPSGRALSIATIEKLESWYAWRRPWEAGQRCILPAVGVYEWQPQPTGPRLPWLIRPAGSDELLNIAAIWDGSKNEAGEEVLSFAILTMPANEFVAEIHSDKKRMPFMLE